MSSYVFWNALLVIYPNEPSLLYPITGTSGAVFYKPCPITATPLKTDPNRWNVVVLHIQMN